VTVTSNAAIEVTVMGQTMPTVQAMEMVVAFEWDGRQTRDPAAGSG
jgi:hypothetical protein